MAISLSAITGGAQTGFTAPTYTPTADTPPPNIRGKQWYISAVGGTQTGVIAHTVSAPFTVLVTAPSALKTLSAIDPVTGMLRSVPRNNYGVLIRKGATPLSGQPAAVAIFRCTFEVPAGTDTADGNSIRALTSCAVGVLSQISAGLGDTLVSGGL